MRSEILDPEVWSENILDLARLMRIARCDYELDHAPNEIWKLVIHEYI